MPFMITRTLFFSHGTCALLPWFVHQAIDSFGVNAARFWVFSAMAILAPVIMVPTIVGLTRPTVVIRNCSGEDIERVVALVCLGQRLVQKYEWTHVRHMSVRNIRSAVLKGVLKVEYSGQSVNGRRDVQLNLLRGEEFTLDL